MKDPVTVERQVLIEAYAELLRARNLLDHIANSPTWPLGAGTRTMVDPDRVHAVGKALGVES